MQWPDIPVFNRPDPKEEDYLWLSPYTFCAANPVMFIDQNGEEAVHICTSNQANEKDLAKLTAQINTPFLAVVGHGRPEGIGKTITSAEAFDVYMSRQGIELDPAKRHVIVLHSCETGKGENSFASLLSKYYSKSVIVAPTGKIAVQTNRILGTYLPEDETVRKGNWGVFVNGVMKYSISGQANITEVINSMFQFPIIPIEPIDKRKSDDAEEEDENENAKTMEHLNYLIMESWKMGATINYGTY